MDLIQKVLFMKFCIIFNLLFFLAFSSNSYSSETFELEGLSSHIKKPLTTFLEDPEIREIKVLAHSSREDVELHSPFASRVKKIPEKDINGKE